MTISKAREAFSAFTEHEIVRVAGAISTVTGVVRTPVFLLTRKCSLMQMTRKEHS